MLYDRLRPLEENPMCPRCANEMNFISMTRRQDGTYRSLSYECPTCQMRETISTRNNVRTDWTYVLGGYAFLGGFLLGVLYWTVMTALTALKH